MPEKKAATAPKKTSPAAAVPSATAPKGGRAVPAAVRIADADASASDPAQYSREERARRYGVDCPDNITWRHWTPGGEYIRKLIFKNTHERLQVIRYNLPEQKATFFVEFPEPVTLSSGMHYELMIRFRPTALTEMRDSIEIVVEGRGSFLVDLIALTPYAKLTAPDKHDFGFCPVSATTRAGISIKNSGTVPLEVYWEVQAPFSIEPAELRLDEGETATLTVSFRPEEAVAVVAKAVCRIRNEHNDLLAVMAVSGVGKYTFLRALSDTSKIDFGGVLTGHTDTKTIIVENKSLVPAAFEIKRTDNDIVCPFTFTPTVGTVLPDGQLHVTIKYKPESTSAQYSSTFTLTAVGGNTIRFNCFGTAIGPTVTLSVKSLDFGDLDLEGPPAADKFIVLKNKSNTEVTYHFVGCEPGNAFAVSPFAGTLAPNKMQNICVSFRPNAPLNYLRRLYVLVKHSDRALHLDLLGTAFNHKLRPAPFSLKQVRYYHLRLQYGLGRITPDDIEKLLKAHDEGIEPADDEEAAARGALLAAIEGAELDPASSEKLLRSVEAGSTSRSASGLSTPKLLPRGTEPLSKVLPADESLQLPYSLEESVLRFRYSGLGEVKNVVVRNHTSTKATASWVMPRENSPWIITPASADIAAFGSTTFQLRLQPTAQMTGTFGHFLECFVHHKSMRSFRLVNEKTFTPSHCLTLHCQCVNQIGETSATPQARVPTHIAFPACHQGDCAFQVVALTNLNDTVTAYDINIDAKLYRTKGAPQLQEPQYDESGEIADQEAGGVRDVFTCYPETGTIPPNGTALVLFRFSPSRLARYRGIAVVSFNESSVGGRQIFLRGQGFVPQVSLTNGGVMSLRPTAIGGETTRLYTITNPSRIAVRCRIQVPERYREVLQVSPEEAILPGFSDLEVKARFTPTSQRRYEMNIPIIVQAAKPPKDQENVSKTQICRVVGEGVIGVVALEPLQVNFGTVLVGAAARRTFTIFNSSLCDVQYRLSWIATKFDGATEAPPLGFLPDNHGTLRARSHVNVDVSITLPFRGDFEYKIYVISHGSQAAVEATEPSLEDVLRLPHCTVTVAGGHPTVEVTDVRSVYQRKSHLWRQMSVVELNDRLREPVSDRDTESTSFTFDAASQGLTPLVCDLGVDTHRTAPIRVLMRLDNSGHCPVDFRFWLPHESDVPKEPWHQDPVKGDGDMQLAEIIDKSLFDISPKRATVPPGGHQVILFTYSHTKVGQHTLPVLLRLDKGKRILLHLTARTLSETARYLSLHHTMAHELLPVAIGDLDPPLQYTELQNLSHHTIIYNIDSDALQDIRERSYDFPVFQCLNPQGVIPPMSTLLLSWYFRPIEAKRYEVKVPITVEQGDSYVLTIGGTGYHPKKVTAKEVQQMHARDVFPLPAMPTLRHPMLPLRLSLDVLRFGPVPQHTLHRRMIVLENHHPRDTFLFEWHSALQYGDQLLDVDPPRGRIKPGEQARMRISLYTGSTSHIIDNPIHCHVLNEDLRDRRIARRDALEREAAMQLDMPAVRENATTSYSATNNSLAQVARESRKKESAAAAAKSRQPITNIPAKFQSTNRLKQAIQALTEAAAAEELDDDDEDQIYVDVLPTVLEVLLQTRIMGVDAYASVYGDVASHRFYYPTFKAYGTPLRPEEIEDMEPFSAEELHMARDVMDELLQRIVHHRAVEDTYCDVTEDPVPYFCQIRQQAADRVEEEEAEAEEAQHATAYASRSKMLDVPTNPAEPVKLAEVADDFDVQDGELQCLVEEVLEGLLFSMLTDDRSEAPLRQALLASRARSRGKPGARSVTMKLDK
jgi:hypothetical protein